jgi:hypothetical protein
MNKRIKEFAKKSGLLGRKFMFGKYYEDELTPEQIKFAKLLIQKCFDVVINDSRFHDAKGILKIGKHTAMEYFGVKE